MKTMAGYNPRCNNCHTCMSCRGNGTVMVPRRVKSSDGKMREQTIRETCPRCHGVGGWVGVGKHDHR
ncbi:MAG: hypothetical protein QM662_11550 [Gordonia sp. (in: high G+C Gram-positive bacteria)]